MQQLYIWCQVDKAIDPFCILWWSRFDHDGNGILRTVDILTSLGVAIEDRQTPIVRTVLSALPSSSKQRKVSSAICSSLVKTLPAISTDINKSTKDDCRELSTAVTTTAEEDKIINDVSKVLSFKYNELLTELKKADPLHSGLVCQYLLQSSEIYFVKSMVLQLPYYIFSEIV